MKKLSIVILDYRKAKSVVENVRHLIAQETDFPVEIVVVDNSVNAENAETLSQLEHLETSELGNAAVSLIINEKNEGYTRGNNRGAKASDGDYIAIVNPDIQCREAGTLQRLVDYLESHPEVGMIGPRQITPQGETEMTVRAFPKLWVQIARRTFLRYVPFIKSAVAYDEMRHLDYEKTQSVQWLQSSFVVMRRALWESFGGFDEDYFIFMSDSEICWQTWKAGQKVIYLADVKVYPDGIRASGGGFFDFFRSWVIRQHFRDACKYQRKHFFERKPKID